MKKLNRILQLMVCLGLITAFLGCEATQKTESTGQYIDDAAITAKIKAGLYEEAALKSLQIEVKTFKGVVQLSGFVDSAQSVTKAGEIARRFEGTKELKNDLVVK
jgi:osmotically-inducible protein OsmY